MVEHLVEVVLDAFDDEPEYFVERELANIFSAVSITPTVRINRPVGGRVSVTA